MRRIKLFALCSLILCLVCLIVAPTIMQGNEGIVRDGKRVLTGPNGRYGCDCTANVYVDCRCNIIDP